MFEAGWRRPTTRPRRSCTRTTTPGRVHAALLRRVPRPARDDRPRRADRRAARRRAACARQVAGDRAYLRAQGCTAPAPRARWTARSARPPRRPRASPRRSARAPTACPVALCARCRSRAAAGATATAHADLRHVARGADSGGCESVREYATARPRCARHPSPDDAERDRCCTSPSSSRRSARGSGGHNTIFRIVLRARALRPHVLGLDRRPDAGMIATAPRRAARARIVEQFAPLSGAVFNGFDDWYGADVRSRPAGRPSTRCCCCRDAGRAPTSSRTTSPSSSPRRPSAMWAERTYSLDLYRDLARARGCATWCASATGADGEAFRSESTSTSTSRSPVAARRDTRGLLRPRRRRRGAPSRSGCSRSPSCSRRRPDTRIVLFGDPHPPSTLVPLRASRASLSPEPLARLYARGDGRPLALADQLLARCRRR